MRREKKIFMPLKTKLKTLELDSKSQSQISKLHSMKHGIKLTDSQRLFLTFRVRKNSIMFWKNSKRHLKNKLLCKMNWITLGCKHNRLHNNSLLSMKMPTLRE
jgi:hypothetical protein